MAKVKCPQCGKLNAETYTNGLLVTHPTETGEICVGSLYHPKDLPRKKNDAIKHRWVPGLHTQFDS